MKVASTRWFRSRGVNAKLILPFAAILVAVLAAVIIVSIQLSRGLILEMLERRAEVLVQAFTSGIPRLEAFRDAMKNDQAIVYLHFVVKDGTVVESTEDSLRGRILLNTPFDQEMTLATALLRRPVPGATNLFEVASPVHMAGQQLGVVRLGVSTRQIDDVLRRGALLIMGVGILGLGVGIAVYVRVSRQITRPLAHVVAQAERAAQGDLRVRVTLETEDELGQMGGALNRMLERFQGLMTQVQQATSQTAVASRQLASGSEQLSSGAGEQASSLEETTSSLEEMSASITQNAEHSRQMEQMALQGAQDAEESGRAVHEAVAAMQAIAERISIVEEIAYQTNLLALNAAIEAARAGEHGRGFAVVATEVRRLAERSQEAAQAISGLASSSVKVAERAGQSLAELVPAIIKTAELVKEVAAASREQATGVAQMNKSMGQMDQITQRNAAAAEELSSTADGLAVQAGSLQELIAFFRVEETPDRPAGPASASQPVRGHTAALADGGISFQALSAHAVPGH